MSSPHPELERKLQADQLPPGIAFGALYRDQGGAAHQVWVSAGNLPLGQPAGEHVTMSPDVSLAVFSCTKLLVAYAAMKLVEQGKIALDDNVADILPEMVANGVIQEDGSTRPLKGEVTVRKLMAHTAGLRCRRVQEESPTSGDHFFFPFIAEPEELWDYACGYDWIERLIARKSGSSFEDYISKHITEPLGIKWHFTEQQNDPLPQTGFFAGDSIQWIGVPEVVKASEPCGGAGGVGSIRAFMEVAGVLANGGVGVTSGARILSEASIKRMLQDELAGTGIVYPNPLPSAAPIALLDPKEFPVRHDRCTIAGEMNLEPLPNGRAAGAITWGGANGIYWSVDPASGTVCVSATQVMPFGHPRTLDPFLECEKEVLKALRQAQ
ncbi:beta-lactamase/transpeptidase-like protein [Auriculariales sp. MPI-PUGE-AT-0066]|nr:beta-lactamase/transpeptidase-like protein [Auriculariales sp. MPI-PUGE-AT-0066]